MLELTGVAGRRCLTGLLIDFMLYIMIGISMKDVDGHPGGEATRVWPASSVKEWCAGTSLPHGVAGLCLPSHAGSSVSPQSAISAYFWLPCPIHLRLQHAACTKFSSTFSQKSSFFSLLHWLPGNYFCITHTPQNRNFFSKLRATRAPLRGRCYAPLWPSHTTRRGW